jgi:dethiobiotin synthetase
VAGRVIVVAGTDTFVGKTCVAAGLARALSRRGLRVVALKPIESGCGDAPRPSEDGVALAEASGQDAPRAALLRLRTAVAPPVAADLEGVSIPFDAIVARVGDYASRADVTIVEGAGGLCSPLAWGRDLTDVARGLGGPPVLVVGSDRLGVVNHALLTIRALAAASLVPLGIVLSAPEAPDSSTGTNAATLRRSLELPLAARILELPRVGDVDEAADRLGDVADWALR